MRFYWQSCAPCIYKISNNSYNIVSIHYLSHTRTFLLEIWDMDIRPENMQVKFIFVSSWIETLELWKISNDSQFLLILKIYIYIQNLFQNVHDGVRYPKFISKCAWWCEIYLYHEFKMSMYVRDISISKIQNVHVGLRFVYIPNTKWQRIYTGQVRIKLQTNNFWQSYGPWVKEILSSS